MDFLMSNVFFHIDIVLLVFIRFLGFFITSPVFGGRDIPSYSKIGLSFIMSTILISTMPDITVSYNDNILGYVLLILKELVVGMLFGFIVYLILSTFYLAGQLIDYQIGFSMINVLDPLSQIQIPITGNFYYLIILALLLVTNGHHKIIQALFYSYNVIPIGEAIFNSTMIGNYIIILSDIFILAIKIASPIIGAILILDVALGILARTAPQMNMFVIGLPLKLIIGLVFLMIITPLLNMIYNFIAEELFRQLFIVIKGLMP
ncbi:flagellar biosynthetic protein FliR [Defluviitalea phaphyphila]|uniref:flagellar biosynthetic protein FliR n=1 Tax=Defluviitalea phaphyphila TaxID=1473580 RepID=UPI0007312CFA|nr:flagellar biosynthetic protein FliR [Defluviitalea phaphyphila]